MNISIFGIGCFGAVSLACNNFHALKISLANETARLCKALGDVDPFNVMELARKDTPLNVSPGYLQPGFALVGSYLSKDLRGSTPATRVEQTVGDLVNIKRSERLRGKYVGLCW